MDEQYAETAHGSVGLASTFGQASLLDLARQHPSEVEAYERRQQLHDEDPGNVETQGFASGL
jgi:hypothetical protein